MKDHTQILTTARRILARYDIEFTDEDVRGISMKKELTFKRALIVFVLYKMGLKHTQIGRVLNRSHKCAGGLMKYGRSGRVKYQDLVARYNQITWAVAKLDEEIKAEMEAVIEDYRSVFEGFAPVFKYVSYDNEEYAKQYALVEAMIHERMNMLTDLIGVKRPVHGYPLTVVKYYIRKTKGMTQEEKMKWLSDLIGYDHEAFMTEWTKLEQIDRYSPLKDNDIIHGPFRRAAA